MPLTFPAKRSASLAMLDSDDGSSDDYSGSDSTCFGEASDDDSQKPSFGTTGPLFATTSGSRRKKRCSYSAIQKMMTTEERPVTSQTIESLLRDKAQQMAKVYGVDASDMTDVVLDQGSTNGWYVCLMTTETKRKTATATHVSRTRSPFRKVALHSLGVVQTKTTRGADWTLRLIIGPFGSKDAAKVFKSRWKRLCRTCDSRMVNGMSQAKQIGAEFYFPLPDDEARFGHGGE